MTPPTFTALKPPAKKSSNIAATGYDEAHRILLIQFTGSGETYCYEGVTPEKAAEREKCESIGRWFAKEIRPNYRSFKLQTAKEDS